MNPSVGEQLRSMRESRGLTLEDAVKATNIRKTYLQELENNHPEQLHSTAQAHGFLRLYASYLKIPAAPLIAQWEALRNESDAPVVQNIEPVEEDSSLLDESSSEQSEKTAQPEEKEKTPGPNASLKDALKRIPKLSQFLPGKKKSDKESILQDQEKGRGTSGQQDQLVKKPISRASKEILADIGTALKERRTALELTLTDVETFTNVKRMYLESMENGAFENLPSTVQGRGMLNNFSQFLALDESWIMDAYAKALQAQRAEKEKPSRRKAQPPLTVRLNIPEKWRRILNPDLIIGGIFIVAIFIFILWGGAQVFSEAQPAATAAPSISEVLQQTPTPTNANGGNPGEVNGEETTVTPIPGVTIVEPTPTVVATVNSAPLQLYIIIKDRAFMRVVVDGVEEFDGRVSPEDVFTFSGQQEISLLTGNGAALEVYFNQEYLGSLGSVGEVADITFSLQGLSTPTPLPASTPGLDLQPADGDAMDAMEEN